MVVLRARFVALPWTLRVGRLALAAVLARGLPGVDLAPELRFRMEGGLVLRFHVDLLSGSTW